MAKQVEFFFDFVSPAAYLAWTQLPGLQRRTGADIKRRPFFLGGVFQSSGNRAPLTVPAKGKWLMRDFLMFARRYKVPMMFGADFPVNSLAAMRAASGLIDRPTFLPYCNAMFNAVWGEGKNIGEAKVRAEIGAKIGLTGAEIEALASAPENKEGLRASSDEAVARGAFGAPTFFVGEEMFFGQDRLDFVEEALMA